MSRVPAHPYPSATVLLLRNGDRNNLEVFMVVRHENISFMGGALVFPGGRVDAADHVLAEAYRGAEIPFAQLPLRVAAIRETFEEAGVLLVRDKATGQLIDHARVAQLQDARARVADDSGEFAKLLAAENLTLALDLLIPYAHWITPVTSTKRFDVHFFAAAVSSDQVASHDLSETVDSHWLTPAEATAGGASGRFQLRFPTRMNLRPLLKAKNVEEALTICRARPIVTVLPVVGPDGKPGGVPAEAGYE